MEIFHPVAWLLLEIHELFNYDNLLLFFKLSQAYIKHFQNFRGF